MTKQKNLPPIKLIGGIRKDILSLLKINKNRTNCYLWHRLADSRIDPKEDNLGLDTIGIKVQWMITPCSSVMSLEKIQLLMAEKVDNTLEVEPEYPIENIFLDNDVIDLDDEEAFYEAGDRALCIKTPETNIPTLKNFLEMLQSIYCQQNKPCEQLHYFVGIGSYVVDKKEYRGVHIIEPYKNLLGPQKSDSVMNQILPLKRLLKGLV